MSTTEWSDHKHKHKAQHNTVSFSLRSSRNQQQRIDRVGFLEAACSSSSIAVGIIGSEIVDEFLEYLYGSTASECTTSECTASERSGITSS